MKVNLYGHSIAVDRSIKNSIDILIFGGKETQDPDLLNSKKISVASHFMSLDTVSGLMTSVCTDTLPPSNRYLQHTFFFIYFHREYFSRIFISRRDNVYLQISTGAFSIFG